MKLNLIDKIWLLGSALATIISLYILTTSIPHYKDASVPWSFLMLIASLVAFFLKIHFTDNFELPAAIFALLIVALIAFVLFYGGDVRHRHKTQLILKSSALTTGEVVDTHVIQVGRFPETRRLGYNVVYRYSVDGRVYLEAVGVQDNPANRLAFTKGNSIVVTYATTDPSVSKLKVQDEPQKP